MSHVSRIACILVGVHAPLLMYGCRTSQPPDHLVVIEQVEPISCGSVSQIHSLEGLILASQPAPEDFAILHEQEGVRTVINLRPESEIKDFDEAEHVTIAGMDYVNLPISGASDLTPAVFEQGREIFRTAKRPMLVHCASGNRVAALWLPYRVLDQGVAWDDALAEAKIIGLRSAELEAQARQYIEVQSRK